MSRTVRIVLQASLLLLSYAVGSCFVGDRQYQQESLELDQWMVSGGFYISHVYPELNNWQLLAFVFFFLSISVAIAAFRLWRQETTCSCSNPGARCYVHLSKNLEHPE